MPNKGEPTRVFYLNKTEVEYILDRCAAIFVISEETAKKAGLNVYPYDKNKVRVITSDGKEVQDVPGYVKADVTLGEHRLKGVKMFQEGKKPMSHQKRRPSCTPKHQGPLSSHHEGK